MTLYRKRGSVIDAVQMPTVFTATGAHGTVRGLPGEWRCVTETGDEFVLDTPTMLLEYEPVAAPAAPQPVAGDRLVFRLRGGGEGEGECEMWWCGAQASEFEGDLVKLKEAVDQRLRDLRRGWRPEVRR
jgi:hypothetical protein